VVGAAPRWRSIGKRSPRAGEREAQTLVSLTGWDLRTIRTKMGLGGTPPEGDEPGW
jgi:hypothetical protein